LATEALEFWREYWERAVASSQDEARIAQAVELLESPEMARALRGAPWPSLIHNIPDDAARSLVDSALVKSAKFTSEQIVNAFKTGNHMYGAVRNVMPITLFTVRLPIVDPVNTDAYLREAARALRAFRLNRAWHSWAENHCPPSGNELAFYERMAQELASNPAESQME